MNKNDKIDAWVQVATLIAIVIFLYFVYKWTKPAYDLFLGD